MIYEYTALFGICVILLVVLAICGVANDMRTEKITKSRNVWRDWAKELDAKVRRFDESVGFLREQLARIQYPESCPYQFQHIPGNQGIVRCIHNAPPGMVWTGDMVQQMQVTEYPVQRLSYAIHLPIAMSNTVYPELVARKIGQQVESEVLRYWSNQSMIQLEDGLCQVVNR